MRPAAAIIYPGRYSCVARNTSTSEFSGSFSPDPPTDGVCVADSFDPSTSMDIDFSVSSSPSKKNRRRRSRRPARSIPNQLASLDTSASRFSLISVTKALLNKPTGEVMNTTMDKDSFGTLPINDLGNSDLYAGLRWTDVDCAMRSYVHDYGG